ncbi:MAG: cytidylate kinase family protein [Patescibacteria group bacterium]
MSLKFDNITISGGISTGKNTLLDNLKPYLEPCGWNFISGGQILRDFAKEYIQPLASLADKKTHNMIDDRTIKFLENGHYAIEAWLAGFFAKKMKNTLRVLLVCKDDALRIDRVVNRDKVSVETAKKYIKEREETNFREWRKYYGNYDFFDPKYYQLVINTYTSGPLETLGKVLDKLGFRNK